jgi:hypothetical protein
MHQSSTSEEIKSTRTKRREEKKSAYQLRIPKQSIFNLNKSKKINTPTL